MTPKGFFSYARGDDEHLGQMLTDLRARIAGEVSMVLGEDIDMFQDIHDLRVGDRWAEKLRAELSEATFLIPVLTPRFYKRDWCREETLTFLNLAEEKGVTPNIFPVLFVPDREAPQKCSVRSALAQFQYKDFTQWRFSTQTKRMRLENDLAVEIAEKLERLNSSPLFSMTTDTEPMHGDRLLIQNGWISDLLRRASRDEESVSSRSLSALSADSDLPSLAAKIAHAIDDEELLKMWACYKLGEHSPFSRRLYTLYGQSIFENIRLKYQRDANFQREVDKYIIDFEGFIKDYCLKYKNNDSWIYCIKTERGKIYTIFSHASGRLDG